MRALERAINMAYGCTSRTVYYSAEIGFEDVPAGHAMIEIDQLPFSLGSFPAPAPL